MEFLTGTPPKPAPYYAKIAAAFRACGMDIADDDFETIDAMSEIAKQSASADSGK